MGWNPSPTQRSSRTYTTSTGSLPPRGLKVTAMSAMKRPAGEARHHSLLHVSMVDTLGTVRVHSSNHVPYQPKNLETGCVLGAYLR